MVRGGVSSELFLEGRLRRLWTLTASCESLLVHLNLDSMLVLPAYSIYHITWRRMSHHRLGVFPALARRHELLLCLLCSTLSRPLLLDLPAC